MLQDSQVKTLSQRLAIVQSDSRIQYCHSSESVNQSIMQNDRGKWREGRRLIERSMV